MVGEEKNDEIITKSQDEGVEAKQKKSAENAQQGTNVEDFQKDAKGKIARDSVQNVSTDKTNEKNVSEGGLNTSKADGENKDVSHVGEATGPSATRDTEVEGTDSKVPTDYEVDEDTTMDKNDEGTDGDDAVEVQPGTNIKITEESAELVLLRQQLNEMSPLYLPRYYKLLPESFESAMFPRSYKNNSGREIKLMEYCDNFCRQYAYLFPDRTRILLTPLNECGIRKCVCTTIRTSKIAYPELYDWQGAAAFVADFLEFVPLVPSNELPTRLLSPSTCVSIQMGTCFEYTTLLCSILIGDGYDAYVVSGYATRECCYIDESRKTCPLLEEVPEVPKMPEEKSVKKYQVKPIKDFNSKFELSMEVKKIMAEKKAKEEKAAVAKAELIKSEEPLPDPLYGLRVHSWILVLAGQREIGEPFFIEPLTGLACDIKSPMYLGIESVWNNANYWVNMQDCSGGIGDMRYNLTVLSDWEHVLQSGVLNDFLIPLDNQLAGVLKRELDISDKLAKFPTALDYDYEPKNEKEEANSKKGPSISAKPIADISIDIPNIKQKADLFDKLLIVDLPLSWALPIVISQAEYDMRYPDHHKVIVYNRARLEKFSPYFKPNGLISRLVIFSDRELKIPLEVRETYKWRNDKLLSLATNLKTLMITEKFDHGRLDCQLKEHGYHSSSLTSDSNRYMLFYSNYRVDGLVKRERTHNQLKEWYTSRRDRLIYREATYGRAVKKFGPAINNQQRSDQQLGSINLVVKTFNSIAIDQITEKFDRNFAVDADEDVAERIFNILEDRYLITYHIAAENIFPCTREFIKPPASDDRRQAIELQTDSHTTFQVCVNPKTKTNVEIYDMLLDLISLEEAVKQSIRNSEREVAEILNRRTAEELNPKLNLSLYDTLRNHEIRQLRSDLERYIESERDRQKEEVLDFLSPFLAMKDSDDHNLTREVAFSVREACLQDLKERLITKANIIQTRFENESQALQKKQQWYQLNQINLSSDDEAAYLKYCNDAIFRITTLESRLLRHKQAAPQKYMMLERKLRMDPRLAVFLQNG